MNLKLASLVSSYFLCKVFKFYLLDGILKMAPLKSQMKKSEQSKKYTETIYIHLYCHSLQVKMAVLLYIEMQ